MNAAPFVCGVLAASLCIGVRAAAPLAQRVATDKSALTPAQRKIDSQLRIEIDRLRTHDRVLATVVRVDKHGRACVDLRGDVTPALEARLKALGSTVVSASVEFKSIVAWVPLKKLEQIAASPAVRAIVPAPEPHIRK